MFYSHDLLGRKTPLGAIWCAPRRPEGTPPPPFYRAAADSADGAPPAP